ncbi:hypothetical protein D3C78_1053170 [compost metagenome]
MYQITQFKQVIGHAEMGVILIDFLLEHGNTPQCAFQAFSGSHNPDVIPHKQSQLMPVMLNDHQFIRIIDSALIPRRKGFYLAGIRRTFGDIFCS